ncbi:snoaL-like polyketide cyclase domain-containing protein [Cordyceps javanica]|uniref:SnoaL-like polyketide cyclase domain-containing protein n=1 Tax=Cordyceps javanica TaxID=43265 RepID=A0A545W3M8_9HYPO|nr:snoaL-like polyketide cyclase domain-containing protein [Cordyceps javanica]TQW08599.1 snoaL-like polyketide cyclase domain-containing protein [Cordyceps javanica]
MPTPEEQRNVAVITEYFEEYWGKGNTEIVDKLCADNFVINYPMHGPRHGKEGAKRLLRDFKEAFPDISFHAYQHPLIASGRFVVGRWIGGGTHTGVAFDDLAVGSLDRPNTGKKIHFSGTTIFTLENGKIVDETGEEGALTALQQLGLVSKPNPGKEIVYMHE